MARTHHAHAVQFYGTESALYGTVATFLVDGLSTHQPALVIATPAHQTGIASELCRRLIDCDQAVRDGDLVLLDAQATLDLFMVGGSPNADLFDQNVGRLVEQVINGRPGVVLRAYGEMVDVLWKQGRPDAAVELELLWNKLALKYDFALLCGYSMGSFYKQPAARKALCAHHSHVISPSAKLLRFPPAVRPRRAPRVAAARRGR